MRWAFRIVMLVILAVLLFLRSRPDTMHVERSAAISAPPESLFAMVNDLHRWAAWSPWDKLDPQMQRSYSGAASGVGAEYAWVSKTQVGEGHMTITESDPGKRLQCQLEFIKPFRATNSSTFTFAPEPGGTKVTWTMDAHNDNMAKVMGMFMNPEKQIGAGFEQGLAQMKTIAEAPRP